MNYPISESKQLTEAELRRRDGVVRHIPDLSARWKAACVDLTGLLLRSVIKALLTVLKMALRLNLETGASLTINTYLGRRSRLI